MAKNKQQISFGSTSDFQYGKVTKRRLFLQEMDHAVPWDRIVKVVEPVYPKGEGVGRNPVPLERMLRIYFLQQWFNLSDPAVEEALYESVSMQAFVGIDLGSESVPDETTVCKFRHLLEKHHLGKKIFEAVNRYLKEQGVKVSGGTIVDASIINAASSTKNKEQQRDPEMHSTRKGNQWYFGAKVHIGADSAKKIIHSVAVSAANVHDSKMLPELLHGKERRVYGDSAYTGKRDVLRECAPHAKDFTNQRGRRNAPLSEREKEKNRTKSSTRCRVEHLFGIMKGVFGFKYFRYRGLAKFGHQVHVLCALTNIFVMKRRLLAT